MLGPVFVMRAVSIPSSKPTINCSAIDDRLHAILLEECTEHRVSRHGMGPPEMVHRRHVDDELGGMCFPVCPKHVPHARQKTLPFVCFLTRPTGVSANKMRTAHETR